MDGKVHGRHMCLRGKGEVHYLQLRAVSAEGHVGQQEVSENVALLVGMSEGLHRVTVAADQQHNLLQAKGHQALHATPDSVLCVGNDMHTALKRCICKLL